MGQHKQIGRLDINEHCMDLLLRMLKMDPNRRINYVDALNHEYFSSIRTATIIYIPLKKQLCSFNKTHINHKYMARQADITTTMRTITIDWLIDIKKSRSCGFSDSCLFLSVHYMDLFLNARAVKKGHLQLVACTCLLLASKIDETYAIELQQLINVSDHCFDSNQLLSMETIIAKTLKFELYKVTEYSFFTLICEELKLSENMKNKVIKLMYLCLLDLESKKYSPYEVALGCIAHIVALSDLDDIHKNLTMTEKSRMDEFNVYITELIAKYEYLIESLSSTSKIFTKHIRQYQLLLKKP